MGGKALKTVGRIHKEEMETTYEVLREHIYQALGLVIGEYVPCGSFLVRESCGDIDIAFDVNVAMKRLGLDKEGITKRLNDLYVTLPEYNYSKGLDIHSIPFPIFDKDGKRTDRYVQVDLMPVENVGMAEWGMMTDGNTPWKSATRNGLIRAISKYKDTNVHTNEDGTVLYFDRLYFDQRHGLFRMTRSYEGKNGRINKTAKTIEKKLVTNDPEEILFILLDVIDVRHSFRNVMDVWSLISDPEHPLFDKIEFIVKEYIDEMERDGFDYPSEIKEWWNEQLEDDCK
jgi:hypothetical protein